MHYFWSSFNLMFANCVHATSASLFTLLSVKIIFDQIVANLPQNNATGIERTLKTFKIWFFWKNRWVFWKKLEFFSKSIKVANLLENAYQMVLFRKMSFAPYLWGFFCQTIRKFWKLEELESIMKCFFERKKPSLQNWEGAKYAGGSRPSCSESVIKIDHRLPGIQTTRRLPPGLFPFCNLFNIFLQNSNPSVSSAANFTPSELKLQIFAKTQIFIGKSD